MYENILDKYKRKMINSILSSLSKKDIDSAGFVLGKDPKGSIYKDVKIVNNTPVSFVEVIRGSGNDRKSGYIMTATLKKYRGKGYSKELSNTMLQEFKKNNKGIKTLYWECKHDNPGSSSIAKALGFKKAKDFKEEDDNYMYEL